MAILMAIFKSGNGEMGESENKERGTGNWERRGIFKIGNL